MATLQPDAIKAILSNEKFQALPLDAKREYLSAKDERFSNPEALPDEDFEVFVSKGLEPEVDYEARQRMREIQFPGTGDLPSREEDTAFQQTSTTLSSALQGAIDNALAGTPEGAARLAGVDINDPESAKFQSPIAYPVGGFLGNFLPAGFVAKTALKGGGLLSKAGANLRNLINSAKTGAVVGGTYGGVGTVAEGVKEGETNLNELIRRGIVGTGIGIGGGTLLGGAVGGIPLARQMISSRKPNAILADVLKVSPTDKSIEKVVSGEYEQALPFFKKNFKKESGVEGLLEAGDVELKERAASFSPAVKSGSAQYTSPTTLRLMALNDPDFVRAVPNQTTREALIKSFESDFNEVNPGNLLDFAHAQNRRVSKSYTSLNPPSSDVMAAEEAVRDVYSNVISQMLKDKNIDPSVYSGYGSIRDIMKRVGKNYSVARVKLLELEGKDRLGRFIEGAEGGVGFKPIRGVKSVVAPLTGGEAARLDSQVNRMMSGVKAPKPLTAQEQSQIRMFQASQEALRGKQSKAEADAQFQRLKQEFDQRTSQEQLRAGSRAQAGPEPISLSERIKQANQANLESNKMSEAQRQRLGRETMGNTKAEFESARKQLEQEADNLASMTRKERQESFEKSKMQGARRLAKMRDLMKNFRNQFNEAEIKKYEAMIAGMAEDLQL